MGIDRWVPDFDEATQHRTDVAAPREVVWRALHESDFADSLLVRLLFAVRGISRRRAGIVEFIDREFALLEEEPPRLLVLGMAGRPARSQIDRVTSGEFSAYRAPGSVRIGWEFLIEPSEGGSRIFTTTRIQATDPTGLRRFRRYWRIVRPFSGLTRRGMLGVIKRRAEDAVRL